MNHYFQQAAFLQSATTRKTLPAEGGLEIAFAGRSNAGKSSVINQVCSQKSLARTSKTPGRTQLINFFRLPDGHFLVDLPGYGYAKVPEQIRLEWQKFIEAYLTQRNTLRGMVLVMDIRHPMTDYDQTMLRWAQRCGLPVHVLLNKADKLTRGAGANVLLQVRKQAAGFGVVSVQTFSALNRQGLDECWDMLEGWLGR
ncbi:MAG TPA: ribosome biogenesis GTP-binding protein YihA/YsxC [Candidatus Thiothrix moscowensis]|uniref:ribosome biogenesis GTP-binding protein YihA/YsxC n=1 Tax=unclassified Thiothrix TaxID=2636184 RepID=UPI0025D2352D|nr:MULTISPECIES: ribosome biogenesis GTP-binding protein YihA/YsxC [unclassified Thiothrix]HRJ53486.1 ribosome biogenesis GTP-binding protein YihA/YsxC [Candidatus Thiothrix moscowensis]HRJ93565.1 ribosome biogenesis GTP-binding protein YihA/YsxC [Candidatus Thiothrix moscowensis]